MIDGIGIANYRSFGPEVQLLGPLRRINLLVGQNNSGKSNVLRFLAEHFGRLIEFIRRKENYSGFDGLDRHLGSSTGEAIMWLGLNLQGDHFSQWYDRIKRQLQPISGALKHNLKSLDHILHSDVLRRGNELAWFQYEAPHDGAFQLSLRFVREMVPVIEGTDWVKLRSSLAPDSGRKDIEFEVRETLELLSPLAEISAAPEVTIVPAIRKVTTEEKNKDSTFGGAGLIQQLAKLQNPGYSEQPLKRKFETINSLLRNVTGCENATLEIPSDRDTILVHMDDKALPLEALGTGIHEVIILASAATAVSNHIVCIEEPEIHLHPVLQRKLVRHLEEKTDNQYFIATHSAHFLEHPDASIFHARILDGASELNYVNTPEGKSSICVDLGYRASDIIQTNCVIWVEGPSDRIYLNHWIHSQDPQLIEGTHYSIMFYGGRLLAHLSANDPEVEDFISLRRLNRFIAIVIDSDKDKPQRHLNTTKSRVKKEFASGVGFSWVTKGREIENYIRPKVLEQAIRSVHKDVSDVPTVDEYGHALSYCDASQKWETADKVKVAREVSKTDPDLDVLDLKERVQRTIRFIREANSE